MKCDDCPALINVADMYEYEEFVCVLGVEGECFKDGSDGCRKSLKSIEDCLKLRSKEQTY